MAPEDKKEYLVRICSTEAEKLGREAKRLGISRSEYMRRAVTGKRQSRRHVVGQAPGAKGHQRTIAASTKAKK